MMLPGTPGAVFDGSQGRGYSRDSGGTELLGPPRYGVLRRLKRQTTGRSIAEENLRLDKTPAGMRGPLRARFRPLLGEGAPPRHQVPASSRRTSAAPAASASSFPR